MEHLPSKSSAVMTIDINCDMGEGMTTDALMMPCISSANIACGYHAGDAATMSRTIELAMKHNVAIGAHVSFHDREHFGRKELSLTGTDVYDLVVQQLVILEKAAEPFGACIRHVKPHGALYNIAAREKQIANAIARAVKGFNRRLMLFGLSGSFLVTEARSAGLYAISEAFADRRYLEDGSLVPRSRPGAMIEKNDEAVAQVLQMIREHRVTTFSGRDIPITAESICLHSDSAHAAGFAVQIARALRKEGISICAPAGK